MNILLITIFFVGIMVSEIPRVSVFGHYPYSVTFPYIRRMSYGNTGYHYYSVYNLYCLFNISYHKHEMGYFVCHSLYDI